MEDISKFSPMMQRYLETKEQYKDCILFYRLGDFYEMFFDDAILVSRELEITLTGKDCGQAERAPMCGVPHHAAESYIARLIAKGYKVAICEQLEDPKTAKGIVERGVIRVVTPGTIVESNMLEERKNNYIMSIYKTGIYYGIAICDISTGEFYASQIKDNQNFSLLLDEIAKFNPSELVVNSNFSNCDEEMSKVKERFTAYITKYNDKYFESNYSLRTECERYNSRFKNTGQERMWVRNKASVTNLNTLAHISLLAVAVAAITSHSGQSYRKLKTIKRIA